MLYWIIIVIEIAEYVYGQVLSLLNVKASKRPIPKVLEGIYDEASYRKQGDIRDTGFDPWVSKIPWRMAWQPTPVILPGESHRQEPAGYIP